MFEIFRPTIIVGIVNKHQVTLYECFQTQVELTMPGIATSEFRIRIVLIGRHFTQEKDIVFKRVEVGFPHLEE